MLAFLIFPSHTSAHCDTLDGPVVSAARKSLDRDNISYVLIWVKPENEDELKKAFKRVKGKKRLAKTKEEKENPELIRKETSRMGRIAQGAGVNTSEVRSLLKQYDMLQSMVKSSSEFDMSKGIDPRQMQKLLKKFGRKKMKF